MIIIIKWSFIISNINNNKKKKSKLRKEKNNSKKVFKKTFNTYNMTIIIN